MVLGFLLIVSLIIDLSANRARVKTQFRQIAMLKFTQSDSSFCYGHNSAKQGAEHLKHERRQGLAPIMPISQCVEARVSKTIASKWWTKTCVTNCDTALVVPSQGGNSPFDYHQHPDQNHHDSFSFSSSSYYYYSSCYYHYYYYYCYY